MSRVVVVTPNPAVDVTYRVARQQLGGTQRVQDVARRPGGKGINVVRVLAQLGQPATSVLPLGGTAGVWIAEQLAGAGFAVRAVDLADDSRTTVTVVDDDAHPTTFNEPGPAIDTAEWRRLELVLDAALDGADLLVVAGSLPRGADPAVLGGWIRRARRAGVRTVIDVSGPALLIAAESAADVIKANRTEVLEATAAADERAAATALRNRGCRVVVVSRGADGVAGDDGSGWVEVGAIPGLTGNPVGAGDAATGGLVVALLAELPLAEVLRYAAAAGAAAVLRPVAGEIDLASYRRFLAELGAAS